MTQQLYKAFDLYIQSSLSLPELLLAEDGATPDVTIQFGNVPAKLEEPIKKGVTFQAAARQLLLKVPDIADFYVTEGNTITISRHTNATDEDIKVFLLGSAFGALLLQREALVLHASAVKYGEKAILFIGVSGAGKSSISTIFRLNGHDILSDDIAVIKFNEAKKPIVMPAYPQSKLWEKSLKGLDMPYKDFDKIRKKINKRAIPIRDTFCKHPLPVAVVYLLNTHNKENVLLEEIKGAEKFNALKKMTYRKAWLEGLNVQGKHFQQGMQLVTQVPLRKITRPNARFCVEEMMEMIVEDLKKMKDDYALS